MENITEMTIGKSFNLHKCQIYIIVGLTLNKISLNHAWIHDTFIPRVQKSGEIVWEHRGLSSAASAASAIYDHIEVLENGSDDYEAIGVISSGEYNITSNLMFSFPMHVRRGSYSIINDVIIDSNG